MAIVMGVDRFRQGGRLSYATGGWEDKNVLGQWRIPHSHGKRSRTSGGRLFDIWEEHNYVGGWG